ncbi:hypothetical protein FOZ62_000396 [Perkinsus olseni]|uniref:Uncharacterized protein n=1 Tax=Perkinsus olseni TaxID=32597 RepID=A0A7J6S7F9_PEROL|nr:hypothetical protein FOZ62_000396 [Perkinsus olseni]
MPVALEPVGEKSVEGATDVLRRASSEEALETDTPVSASFSSALLKSALKRAARKTYPVSWALSIALKQSCLQLAEHTVGLPRPSSLLDLLELCELRGSPVGQWRPRSV